MKIEILNSIDSVSTLEKNEIINFLYGHLDEYGDMWENIERSVEYALSSNPAFGGFILINRVDGKINGVIVMNQTKMKGYIPENVLVYIAVHKDYRENGIGKELMKKAIQTSIGNIALHVEPDNPAIFLYKKVGFINPYLELRYYKK
jgi:ribosomal protein S18 acetylase RimI-like enzyme